MVGWEEWLVQSFRWFNLKEIRSLSMCYNKEQKSYRPLFTVALKDDVYPGNQVGIYKHKDLFWKMEDVTLWKNGEGVAIVNTEQLVHFKSAHKMAQSFIQKVQRGHGQSVLRSMVAGATMIVGDNAQVRNAA